MRKIFWLVRTLFLKPFLGALGAYSYIGSTTYICGLSRIFIGRKVRIYPNARIESLGGNIKIEHNTSIGQNLHLISSNNVFIGQNTTISANVFISDVDHSYDAINVHIMEQPLIKSETIISENCFIGYGAVILPGSTLGKQCIVGANSVVRGHFPDYSVIVGSPAKVIKRYNVTTMRWQRTDSDGKFL
ncbi:DapH/DapD/GlmU-related protein [Aeromonas veronii]